MTISFLHVVLRAACPYFIRAEQSDTEEGVSRSTSVLLNNHHFMDAPHSNCHQPSDVREARPDGIVAD
jgi:hypothetical protein